MSFFNVRADQNEQIFHLNFILSQIVGFVHHLISIETD